ncbi:MAG: type VI secretion system Vgr family protein [Thermodesulfobacteriota bacterium]
MTTGNNQKRFSFVSDAVSADTFGVVNFKGEEGLSTLYQFEIELIASDSDLDINEMIQERARLKILREGGDIEFHGMLREFEQQHKLGKVCFYRAVLVPRMWWLSQTRENRVFLNTNTPDIIRKVLKSADFTEEQDFSIHLEKENYPDFDYVCQYNESHLDFIQRLMEREGIYYYFEQTDTREKRRMITPWSYGSYLGQTDIWKGSYYYSDYFEQTDTRDKLIIIDSLQGHKDMEEDSLPYAPPSGLNETDDREVVPNFSCRQQIVPASVVLKTYNWEKPSTELECSAEVFEEGRGSVYIYGDNFKTQEEGQRLAGLRAEELNCWKESFFGDSNAPSLRPGYTFELKGHFRKSFNQEYLTVGISHEGNQSAFLLAGYSGDTSGQNKRPTYNNSFTALPSDVQFRPQRRTEKPRIHGTLNAEIDAAGDGTYAELNDNGCYKVKMPFDRGDHQDGKASAWIRMMRPYAGADHGSHFPLHKGTEVLISFINGDPDQPVIAGAVANTNNADVVNNENDTQCRILTSGKNKIEFEDKKGQEQIKICCPHEDSILKLGYPTDNKAWYERMGFDLFGSIGTVVSLFGPAGWIKAACDLAGVAFGGHDIGVEDGIEMRTGNGLKVAARKKEECIGSFTGPGYSQVSVVGLNSLAVKGFSEKSIIGGCNEKTLGRHTFTAVGDYTTTEAGHTQKRETIAEHISGKVSNVFGEDSKLAGKVYDIVGSATDMAGKAENYIGDEVIGKGKESVISGAKSAWTGATNKLRGKKSEVNGEDSELVGEEMQVIGKSNSMSGSSTTLNGDETSMSAKSTSLDGNKTEMSTANTELAATKNIM